mgnify:CR=1
MSAKFPLAWGNCTIFWLLQLKSVTFRCYQTKERETIISFLVSNNEFKEDWRLVTNKIHKKTLAP